MADLLDIAPSTAVESVKIDDRFLTVRGLNGEAIASIVSRFPDLAKLLAGNANEVGPKLIGQFGHAIAPIIAAACGHCNDDKTVEYEQAAANLLPEQQLDLIAAVI